MMVVNQTGHKEKHIHVFATHHFPFSQAYAKDISSKGGFTIYARATVARLPALYCNRKCIQDSLGVRRNAWLELFTCCNAHPNHCLHFRLQHNAGNRAMLAQDNIVNSSKPIHCIYNHIHHFRSTHIKITSLKLDYTRTTEKGHVHVCTYPKLFSQGLSLSVTGQIHWLPIRQDLCLCNNTHVNIGRFQNYPLHSTDRFESMSAQNGCAES